MKTITFESRDEWLAYRKGKITGSTLKSVYSKKGKDVRLKGFYTLIVERIAVPRPEGENKIARGNELEKIAIARFEKETGKKVNTDLVMWVRDDNENIALSPDGTVENDETEAVMVPHEAKYVEGSEEAVEVKCLSQEAHLEAYLTKKMPIEYEMQAHDYFVVNDKLQTLYLVMYDPSLPCDYICFTIKREDIAEKVAEYLEYQRNTLAEVERITSELLNF